jgi:hypothetical protein
MATVFVVDLSAEAEEMTRTLRAAGHLVVDVLPSMLVARVAVQRPSVVLVDADAEGALDVVERMRELPEAEDIHVLFIARPRGAIASPEEALAHEGSGLFVRPVDVAEVLRKVHLLTAGARAGEYPLPTNLAPPVPLQALSPTGPGSAPSLPPASMRASIPPAAPDTKSSAPPSPRTAKSPSDPPLTPGTTPPRRVMSLAPPVSAELQQLLAEAEQRVHVQVEHESVVPSPEDEIEAVLPADLLAALDEPLDEDDDYEDPIVLPRSPAVPGVPRERAGSRGGSRATRGPGAGGAPTTSNVPRTGSGGRPSETPATPSPPHTHGGTHAGPMGEGVSTTGGSDAREPLDAGVHAPESSMPAAWGASAPTTGPQARDSRPPSRSNEASVPAVLGPGDAMRMTARTIAARTTGSLCVAGSDAERRIVLREGDVVTTSSTSEDESLLAFLGVRGDLPRETVRRLTAKFPAHGRHAGAALVARGYLLQDQMWPTLRAHAEWLLAHALQTPSGRLVVEPHPPGRLAGEPSVFGGSTGAAVFVEVVRRVVPPAEAVDRLGGTGSKIGEGPESRLLEECTLDSGEFEHVRTAPGRTIRDILEAAPEGDLVTVIFALTQLGVLDVQRAAGDSASHAEEPSAPDLSALDAEAVRERVRARLQLVDDGDYFALLGVPRDATGYEVRRAFVELRRAFDPSRLLAPEVSDLAGDVRKITVVLEEAYDILKDAARRERYRRAIDAVPDR